MREKLPRITSATALDKLRVHVNFEDGWTCEVDLSGFIADFKSSNHLKMLRCLHVFCRKNGAAA
ncbi:MAG: hypothetical protein IPN53_08680 [Comamonadaceae bacterium]|nr:hypothetical protein [Comamonadaceae bacterium]